MIPLFLVLTALRKFIIVAIYFIFVILRASNFLMSIIVLLNNDVCILFINVLNFVLEGVFLCFFCFFCFLFILGIEPNLHFIWTSRWVDTVCVIYSTVNTIMSLWNFLTVHVRLFPSFISTCITVRCLHVEGWNHFLESVRLKWANSSFPVDGLIPTMYIVCRVHLPILQTILYLASTAWTSAMCKR